ncbi:MAG: hypothetical protein ACXWL5_04920 [Candidatus Chromulinivorax sp.]
MNSTKIESKKFTYHVAELYIRGDGEFGAMYAQDTIGINTIFEKAMKNNDLYEHIDEQDSFDATITWYKMSSKQDAKRMAELHHELDQRQDYDQTKAQNSYLFICKFDQDDNLVSYKMK